MSPRRNRRLEAVDGRPHTALTAATRSVEKIESWSDGDWVVRHVPGVADGKPYRCPGCDHELPSSTGHLVCWPAEGGGVDNRRHWHRACWQARDRRAPTPRRRG